MFRRILCWRPADPAVANGLLAVIVALATVAAVAWG